MQMANGEESRADEGICSLSVSRAVPGLAFATVRMPCRDGLESIGVRVRKALAERSADASGKNPMNEKTPWLDDIARQRLYAGDLEPLPSGERIETLLPPPSTEAHALEDWKYFFCDWAVLCARPNHLSVYAAAHADIKLGAPSDQVTWKQAFFSRHPLLFIDPRRDGILLGVSVSKDDTKIIRGKIVSVGGDVKVVADP